MLRKISSLRTMFLRSRPRAHCTLRLYQSRRLTPKAGARANYPCERLRFDRLDCHSTDLLPMTTRQWESRSCRGAIRRRLSLARVQVSAAANASNNTSRHSTPILEERAVKFVYSHDRRPGFRRPQSSIAWNERGWQRGRATQESAHLEPVRARCRRCIYCIFTRHLPPFFIIFSIMSFALSVLG